MAPLTCAVAMTRRISDFDNALLIAAMLAAFAILFGTREVLSSESHHGMASRMYSLTCSDVIG